MSTNITPEALDLAQVAYSRALSGPGSHARGLEAAILAALPELLAAQPAQPAAGVHVTQQMLDAGAAAMLDFRKSGGDWTDKPRHAAEAVIRAVMEIVAPAAGEAAQAEQQGAGDAPYSIDADPAGIRSRVADVITGVLMLGAQGHTPPPADHWTEPFWQAARADASRHPPAAQGVDLGKLRELRDQFLSWSNSSSASDNASEAWELAAEELGELIGSQYQQKGSGDAQ